MNLKQLALQRYVLEKVKNSEKLEITGDEKVDLDYLHNYWDNLITETEKEMEKKHITSVNYWMNIQLKGEI